MKTIKLLDTDELLMLSMSNLLEPNASYHIGEEFFMTDYRGVLVDSGVIIK